MEQTKSKNWKDTLAEEMESYQEFEAWLEEEEQ